MTSVSSIITGAFKLVRDRPAAIGIWALIHLAASFLMLLGMRPFLEAQAAGGAASVSAAGSMIGFVFLLDIFYFLLLLVLYAAAMRAVLKPERPGFFYLRLGTDELLVVILGFGLIIAFYIAFAIAGIAIGLAAVAMAAAGGTVAAIIFAVVCGVVGLGAIVWLEVRLSLAFPLTLLRGRLILGESWRLTRGRFWTLFGAYFCIFLIVFALWTAVTLLGSGSYLADLARNGFNPEGLRAAQEQQMARQLSLNPLFLLSVLSGAVVGALSIALFGGAAATAVRELTFNPDEIADTFS